MSIWNDETKVARLTELWGQGHSASKIAQIMGLASRNVVIGKVHRLKLAGRPPRTGASKKPPVARRMPPAHKMARIPKQRVIREPGKPVKSEMYVAPPLPPNEPASLGIELLDLKPRDCRYPHGDGPYTFCGHPVSDIERSYCDFHHSITNVPHSVRRERRHVAMRI